MSGYSDAKRQRIYTLSAAKGIACFIVAANHYFNLYPITLSIPLLYLKKWFANGSYMVYLFLAISYFLASLKYYQTENLNIGRETLVRYLKLIFPIMILYTIVYILNKLNLFSQLESAMAISGGGDKAIDYSKITSLPSMYKTAIFRTLIKSTSDFVFPLWMIYSVFIGDIIAQIFSGMWISIKNEKTRIIVAILSILILRQIDFYYVLCILASCLALAYYQNIRMPRLLVFFSIILGIAVGFHRGQSNLDRWIYIAGSTALLFVCINSQLLNNLCTCRLSLVLEEMSFPIYLIHQPVTTSFCAYLYLCLNATSLSTKWQNAISFFAFMSIIIFFSGIWLKLLQPLIKKGVSFCMRFLIL